MAPYSQGSSRGQKRRAASPPEFGKGGRGYEGFHTQGQERRKVSRHTRHTSSNKQSDFRYGAGEKLDLTACAICLSRAPHNIRECKATRRWDGMPAQYSRNSENRIIDNQGNIICSDWQCPQKCPSTKHRHECSGCGNSAHGAQDCPLVQPRNHNSPTA